MLNTNIDQPQAPITNEYVPDITGQTPETTIAQPEPFKTKYLGKSPDDLGFIGKLGAIAEADAMRKRAEGDEKASPNYLSALMRSMGKDPSLAGNQYAEGVRGDVGNAAKTAGNIFEGFARGYTGGNWTTAAEKEQAQKNIEAQAEQDMKKLTQQIEAQKAEAEAGREFQTTQADLDREAQKYLQSGQLKSAADIASFNAQTQAYTNLMMYSQDLALTIANDQIKLGSLADPVTMAALQASGLYHLYELAKANKEELASESPTAPSAKTIAPSNDVKSTPEPATPPAGFSKVGGKVINSKTGKAVKWNPVSGKYE